MEEEITPDFNICFEEKADYLSVFVSGPADSLAVSKAVWKAIYARATSLKISKVLVEEDFPNQLSTIEIHELVEFSAALFRVDFEKIAHVDRQLSDMDLNLFAETVAVNRGISFRVFNNTREALKWLSE